MTSLEFSLQPGVPQWSIPTSSPPFRCHSIPSQQPIGIQIAQIDPSQELTATHLRDNISGFGLSSPALQQPPTKPFSGPPSRQQMTGPYREAREAGQQRPGLLYPLLPRAARPDTRLEVDAALPEAAALDRRSRPPTVLDIADPSQTEGEPQPGPSQPRKPRSPPSRKRRRNRSTGVYRPKKRSPP